MSTYHLGNDYKSNFAKQICENQSLVDGYYTSARVLCHETPTGLEPHGRIPQMLQVSKEEWIGIVHNIRELAEKYKESEHE